MSDNLRHAKAYEKLLSEKEALERRLAEAEETIKNLQWDKFEAENESSMKNDKIAELKSHLRAASESLVNLKQTLRDYHAWDSPALRDIWKRYNELEVTLRGEAEG